MPEDSRREPMDYDVNNQAMLQAGVVARSEMRQAQDWQPMSGAPRDGTIVEIRCAYGVAPWFDLMKWDGTSWESVTKPGHGLASESSTETWRPYNGDISNYVDPTGGAQQSAAYWRGAAAASIGRPPNYFEEQTARNVGKAEQPGKRGFWGWLFGK